MRMKITSRLAITAFVCLSFICVVSDTGQAALQGACAKVNITPPLGIPLIGSKGKPSDAVMDELYAKAMVLTDGSNTVAIVSADLLYAPLEEITDPVRAIVEEKAGIPRQNVMVCAIHTHSGPEIFTNSKLAPQERVPASQIDQSYVQVLVRKMADSVLLARQNLREVKIGAAVGCLNEVLYNRRPVTKDGRTQMAFTLPPEIIATRKIETTLDGHTRVSFAFAPDQPPLTFGPIDPAVFVLRMEDPSGGLVGSLVSFGCHPVCIYPSMSTTICADYPAFASGVIERAEGGINLFALGLAGNAVPLKRGAKPCEQIGKALGGEAMRRLQLMTTTDQITLQAYCRQIELPIKQAAAPDGNSGGAAPQSITTELQLLKLGDIYVLGLPGEVLVEVGLQIEQQAGIERLLIVTLANDSIGYVCHERAYEEGGYEPEAATNLAKGAAEIMIEQAMALLHAAQ